MNNVYGHTQKCNKLQIKKKIQEDRNGVREEFSLGTLDH